MASSSRKCVHKGCEKVYTDADADEDDACVYHPGPPIFHEGTKGWKCCKARVLEFDKFLDIPGCTTGKHSDVDDTPPEEPQVVSSHDIPIPDPPTAPQPSRAPVAQKPATPPPAPPESESDDPSIPPNTGMPCRRRGCQATFSGDANRDGETCVFHPGAPVFHDGGKGYACCRRVVLEFDEFMRIEGCKTKSRHMFVGSGRKLREQQAGEEMLESVRNDFYQSSTAVIVSFYLKKIDSGRAKVEFSRDTIELDLPTADKKRFKSQVPLYAPIDPDQSSFKIMGTKLEMNLAKADGAGWPTLRSDDRKTGEIIQVGQAARA